MKGTSRAIPPDTHSRCGGVDVIVGGIANAPDSRRFAIGSGDATTPPWN